MCVILICNKNVRPSRHTIDDCERANPHGAGVAWRENGEVHWMKNLDSDDLWALMPDLPGEIVIHFRWASVGGVDPDLCHPFPVSATADPSISGACDHVLFHNGTWGAWEKTLSESLSSRQIARLTGPMSDTRAAALCASKLGVGLMNRLPGRWVSYTADATVRFGDWQKWNGMVVSNTHFVREFTQAYSAKPRVQGELL